MVLLLLVLVLLLVVLYHAIKESINLVGTFTDLAREISFSHNAG